MIHRLDAHDLLLELRIVPVHVPDELELGRGRAEDEDGLRVRQGLGDLVVVVLIFLCAMAGLRAGSGLAMKLGVRLRGDDRRLVVALEPDVENLRLVVIEPDGCVAIGHAPRDCTAHAGGFTRETG
ncbi:MAG: hypothetical protein QM820_19925 [Minicystis sp.]